MKTWIDWKKAYEQLLEKYTELNGEYMELSYQHRCLEEKSRQELLQNEKIYKIHQNARKLKHDMKNHVMVIAAYLQEDKTEEAKQYLSEILDKLNRMYTYVETGNSLMNHILNSKLEKAQKKGIQIKARIENISFGRMESMDFSAVLANLLDNAVENCSVTEPAMEIEIARKRGYDCICVKNRIAGSVFGKNPELQTTKEEEGHGYGILQVKEVVEKYEGLADFYEEDLMFVACVMIPCGE